MGRTLIDTWGAEGEEEESFELVQQRPVPRGVSRRPMIQEFPAAADRDWGGTVVQYPVRAGRTVQSLGAPGVDADVAEILRSLQSGSTVAGEGAGDEREAASAEAEGARAEEPTPGPQPTDPSAGRFAGVAGVTDTETVLVGPRRTRTAPKTQQQRYLDTLLDVIPIEVITAWVFIAAIADAATDLPLTIYFGLAAFVTVIAGATIYATATPETHSQEGREPKKTRADRYGQAALAMVAFVIWVYYLQGPFGRLDGYVSSLGPIMLALFAISSPFLPKLTSRLVYRVSSWFDRDGSVVSGEQRGRAGVTSTSTAGTADDHATALVLTEIRGAVGAAEDPMDEFVTFANSAATRLDVSGWTIHDAAGHAFEIPDGVVLNPGGTLTLVTGVGEDDRDPGNVLLHWNASRPVWNDDSDVVSVRDAADRARLRVAYGHRQ